MLAAVTGNGREKTVGTTNKGQRRRGESGLSSFGMQLQSFVPVFLCHSIDLISTLISIRLSGTLRLLFQACSWSGSLPYTLRELSPLVFLERGDRYKRKILRPGSLDFFFRPCEPPPPPFPHLPGWCFFLLPLSVFLFYLVVFFSSGG